jgi:hypothetical protein
MASAKPAALVGKPSFAKVSFSKSTDMPFLTCLPSDCGYGTSTEIYWPLKCPSKSNWIAERLDL